MSIQSQLIETLILPSRLVILIHICLHNTLEGKPYSSAKVDSELSKVMSRFTLDEFVMIQFPVLSMTMGCFWGYNEDLVTKKHKNHHLQCSPILKLFGKTR